jgi:hypothetical protein
VEKLFTYPIYRMPDTQSYILQGRPQDVFALNVLEEDLLLAKLCYMNVCSNSGLYKIPKPSGHRGLLQYLNAEMVRDYLNLEVPKGSGCYSDMCKALVIAPRHMMSNAMHANFLRGSSGIKTYEGSQRIVPVVTTPIVDSNHVSDIINITFISSQTRQHGDDVKPSFGVRFSKARPYYEAPDLFYHGRNKEYEWDEDLVFEWAQILKDFLVAYTEKGDLVLSTTGDLAILGIACLESRRFLVGAEPDAAQFKLDSYIMKDYTKRFYNKGKRCLK